VIINVFNFFRHYKSPPFHFLIRIRLISLSYHISVVLPSQFNGANVNVNVKLRKFLFDQSFPRDVVLEYRTWTRVRLESRFLDLDLDLRPVDLDLDLTPPDLRLGLDTSGLEPDLTLA